MWAWSWYQVTSHSLGTKHSNIESIWVVYIHSSNNLFCSFLDGIDTRRNNSFIQWLYIETIRDSEPFQYLMLGKSYDFRNCYSFEYSFDVCIQYASLTLSNGMKIFFWFHLQIQFFRFLRRKYSARCCCLHTSNARYLEYGTSSNKGSFFVASFLDKHSWYISADCILSNCFNNKNGWFCNGAVVFIRL